MKRFRVADHRDTYDALRTAYSETHRFYHSAEHISACLRRLDEVAELANVPEEVELALWFHDAIYAPRGRNNERKSADWASDFLTLAGVREERRGRVWRHIIATEHNAVPTDPDSALVVDIDLAILGSSPEAYQVFEANIRREYKWAPGPLYRRKRRDVLESFLTRPSIYGTDYFRDRCESAARANLRAAIRALQRWQWVTRD